MPERVPVREILNSTHAFFFRHLGHVVAPALVADFLEYWANWGSSWLQRRVDFALVRQFRWNMSASIAVAVPIGVLLRLLVWAVEIFLWGFTFAVIARMVIPSEAGERISLVRAARTIAGQQEWLSLLWRLYYKLAIPGYLTFVLMAGAAFLGVRYLHLDFASTESRILSELFSMLLFGSLYLVYAYRFALAIPLPIAAGDTPVDPFVASSAASKRWFPAILISCWLVMAIADFADLHLAGLLNGPSMIRPTLFLSYPVNLVVALVSSLPWAWLFVFLTKIAMASAPEEISTTAVVPEPTPIS